MIAVDVERHDRFPARHGDRMTVNLLGRPLVPDDLAELPDDGNRYELIDGELYVSPAPTPYHQITVTKLASDLNVFVETSKLGVVMASPVEVMLGGSLVEPDVVVVRRERREIIRTGRIEGAPDLVVEVLSPSNRSYDTVLKSSLYERHGVAEYWILDPITRTATVRALRDGRSAELTAAASGTITSRVIPGFTFEPASFFARVYDEP